MVTTGAGGANKSCGKSVCGDQHETEGAQPAVSGPAERRAGAARRAGNMVSTPIVSRVDEDRDKMEMEPYPHSVDTIPGGVLSKRRFGGCPLMIGKRSSYCND